MQRNSANPGKLSNWVICTILALGTIVTLAGCNSATPPAPTPTGRQVYAGVSLTLECNDSTVAKEFHRRTAAWCKRTGAVVTLAPDADIQILPPGDIGKWIARDELRPVPDDMRNSAHTLQWSRCLPVWSERLTGWGGNVFAIPLAGESYVLAYRIDLLEKAAPDARRPIAPPATWEEYTEWAERLSANGGAGLPKLAEEPNRALREFIFAAACFDRPALTTTEFTSRMQTGKLDSKSLGLLSFFHDIQTGEPRLKSPSFAVAAALIQRMARCRSASTTDDPMTELTAGRAAMAIVSLAELGRATKTEGAIGREIGIAPLPGTKVWYDAAGSPQPPADKVRGVNFVPVFGFGGWIGAVRNRCPNSEAAFELLADLSSLDRSTELLSDPSLGFGPFRVEHLDSSRETIWQRYGFDAEGSKRLAAAVRTQTGAGLAVAAVGLRGPDRTELMGILAREFLQLSRSTPEAVLAKVDAAWRDIDANRPKDQLQKDRRKAVGLN